MQKALIFVTAALIVTVACTPKKDERKVQAAEGNVQIQQAVSAKNQLAEQYEIFLALELLHERERIQSFNWMSLSKADRQTVKEKLAAYVTSVSRTLEIDAKEGVYLEGKELLLLQLEMAQAYQKALANFERLYGENFEPRNPQDQPRYLPLREA